MTDIFDEMLHEGVNEIKSRIISNTEALGFPSIVTGDIEVNRVIDSLPLIAVIPVGDGSGQSTPHLTGAEEEHRFPIDIIGYYRMDEAHEYEPIQKYGYACKRLFQGDGLKIKRLNIRRSSIRFGEYVVVNKLIYTFRVTLNMITIGE